MKWGAVALPAPISGFLGGWEAAGHCVRTKHCYTKRGRSLKLTSVHVSTTAKNLAPTTPRRTPTPLRRATNWLEEAAGPRDVCHTMSQQQALCHTYGLPAGGMFLRPIHMLGEAAAKKPLGPNGTKKNTMVLACVYHTHESPAVFAGTRRYRGTAPEITPPNET